MPTGREPQQEANPPRPRPDRAAVKINPPGSNQTGASGPAAPAAARHRAGATFTPWEETTYRAEVTWGAHGGRRPLADTPPVPRIQ
ncbi:hypothetical protein NDU88_006867 [Pleurodeles waltl]|uniref:Uncharacterized protein n=1 Tax=Pleurodeles waltl TaxID=8319 RepID=A0AAV7RNP9_PLEWA|nr:hypothetical protein NDU88_006867 [Pleurodeles waltl]